MAQAGGKNPAGVDAALEKAKEVSQDRLNRFFREDVSHYRPQTVRFANYSLLKQLLSVADRRSAYPKMQYSPQ